MNNVQFDVKKLEILRYFVKCLNLMYEENVTKFIIFRYLYKIYKVCKIVSGQNRID